MTVDHDAEASVESCEGRALLLGDGGVEELHVVEPGSPESLRRPPAHGAMVGVPRQAIRGERQHGGRSHRAHDAGDRVDGRLGVRAVTTPVPMIEPDVVVDAEDAGASSS
jgi:hypothetical protein